MPSIEIKKKSGKLTKQKQANILGQVRALSWK